jgi:hypothetical protein
MVDPVREWDDLQPLKINLLVLLVLTAAIRRRLATCGHLFRNILLDMAMR